MMKKVLFLLIANDIIDMIFDDSVNDVLLRIGKVVNENRLVLEDENVWHDINHN